MCEIAVLNYGKETTIVLEASLFSSQNKLLFRVVTRPFHLVKGLNTSLATIASPDIVSYSSEPEAIFIRSHHVLPSGNYLYCCSIKPLVQSDDISNNDEFCEDLFGEQEKFLYLIYPADHDTIETLNPVLIWNHGIDNNFSSNEESYRIILAELTSGQSAQEGIEVNNPLFYENYLKSHQIPYPLEAQPLQKGKHYGWEIQRIVRGVVVNTTEAWDFYTRADQPPIPVSYVVPKKSLDAGFYLLQSEFLYFKFDNEYMDKDLKCRIIGGNSSGNLSKIAEAKDENGQTMNADYTGSNIYRVDTGKLNLKKGSYVLEITNSKGEKFYIKLYVDK
jgi:hypothetical protein